VKRRSTFVAAGIAIFVVGLIVGAVLSGSGQPRDDDPPMRRAPSKPDDVSSGLAGDEGELSTERTAEDAAVEYATASQQWLYLTDEEIEAEVRRIASPATADRLVEETVGELGLARDGLMQSAGGVWWFVRPLAVKTVSVSDARAEVSVWVVTVLSAADVAVPQADWATLDLVLVSRGDEWLLESIDDEPGPTPISGVRDDPWEPEPFDDALDGFVRIGSGPA
jgi:hypothetical protein